VQKAVDAAYAKYKGLQEGKNADYIPALAKVDPNLFGIAVVTPDGKVYSAGDIKTEVSIQSISKVFTMAQVIQEQGLESVEKRIGVDATGARFNSIIAIEGVRTVVGTGAPEMNPLVNPGAISATSMVTGKTSDEVWKKIIGFHNDAAGRPLNVLQDIYKSESDTNQRNQAIGALMLAYGYIKDNWQQAVDLYTRQCSIGVNAKDLAMMAATLAAAGKNPVTGKQVWTRQGPRPGRDVHRRTVRRLREVVVPYRPSGQERRRRRHHRRVPRQVRHRRGLAAPRRRRQQREGAARQRRYIDGARGQPVRGEVGRAGFGLWALARAETSSRAQSLKP
jgi:glutaminase